MIAQSRKELLDLLMLDDFVARREALEHWEAKWIATLELVHIAPRSGVRELNRQFPGKADLVARSGLTAKMVEALVDDACLATEFLKHEDQAGVHYVLRLRAFLTEGRT